MCIVEYTYHCACDDKAFSFLLNLNIVAMSVPTTIPSSVGIPKFICCSIKLSCLSFARSANLDPIGLSSGCSPCKCSAARVVSQVWAPLWGVAFVLCSLRMALQNWGGAPRTACFLLSCTMQM